jgi:hypothetical protein
MRKFHKIKPVLVLCILFFFVAGFPAFHSGFAFAQDDWMKEFADICSKTQDAMTFTDDQLRDLVARSDRLKVQLERLEGTQRKVYLKRLQMCRDLFAFVLETKEKK